MLGTKVEITLPKAEPGHWTTLEFPKAVTTTDETAKQEDVKPTTVTATSNNVDDDDDDSDIDLNDIEQVRGVKITDA